MFYLAIYDAWFKSTGEFNSESLNVKRFENEIDRDIAYDQMVNDHRFLGDTGIPSKAHVNDFGSRAVIQMYADPAGYLFSKQVITKYSENPIPADFKL